MSPANNRASDGYAARGEFYDARPEYPSPLLRDVILKAGLQPGDRVVEIGSGHGKLTEKLLDAELEVYAVEPGNMRAQAESRLGSRANYHGLEGDALAPNLPVSLNGVVKAIFVGQALHWWRNDFKAAVGAWHKFLRPGGKLVAPTYHFDDTDDFIHELDDALSIHCRGYTDRVVKLCYQNSPGFSDQEYRRYFAPGDQQCEIAHLNLSLTETSFTHLLASFSFTPNPQTQADELDSLLTIMRDLFRKHASGNCVIAPYTLKIWHGTLVQPSSI